MLNEVIIAITRESLNKQDSNNILWTIIFIKWFMQYFPTWFNIFILSEEL